MELFQELKGHQERIIIMDTTAEDNLERSKLILFFFTKNLKVLRSKREEGEEQACSLVLMGSQRTWASVVYKADIRLAGIQALALNEFSCSQ